MSEQDIYIEAMDRQDPSDRQRYLDEACVGDSALRERVEKLIRQSDQLGSFLEHPPLEAVAVEAGALGDSNGEIDATILHGDGSTYDDEGEGTSLGQLMSDNQQERDDEIPLGYLQPSSEPNSLGRLGHYEVLEVVGRGAFGTVLRTFDEKLQRVVAIKVLAPEMASTSPARKRFLREARTSAAVRHENVVAIYAVEDDPIPYLVMEYIPGKTLQQRLDEQGPLHLPDVLRLGKQIADGLAAAHAQDLIHRDVKPGNILLEGGIDERVKITDFGLARTADDASMTQSGVIAGTPMYMAPEQAHGHKLNQRADLFSFGSVLYQMLSGRPPFRARTTMAVLKRVTEDVPRPIQEIIPEVPEWMCTLVGHLHAKNPDERYGSAREVSELLAQCAIDLQAGRVPEIPDPSQRTDCAEETPAQPVQPRRSESRLHSPLLKVVTVLVIVLGVLGITEATGVTKLFSTIIPLTTGSGTLVIPTGSTQNAVVAKPPRPKPFQWPADAPPLAIAPFDAEQAMQHQQAWAKYLGVTMETEIVVGRNKDGKDIKLTMVLIPPGEFLMGSSDEEQARFLEEAKTSNDQWGMDRISKEGPQHRVRITRPFWLSRYEVTLGQFRQFVEETGYKTDGERDGKGGFGLFANRWSQDPRFVWNADEGSKQADDHPVVNVSWNDATAFRQWLSKRHDGVKYELPTEAQWEYACRAGTTTAGHYGDSKEAMQQHGWCRLNAGGKTHTVGQLRPNGFGVYDIYGNAWEWCQDYWVRQYDEKLLGKISIDPLGPSEGKRRALRGAGWFHGASHCRSAIRNSDSPNHSDSNLGFRLSAAFPEELIQDKINRARRSH
jgi:formylglycine-generating enzyme required for sulfatase activity/serine/threonine protein kinase